MLVKLSQLQEGCILAEDVIGKSGRAIMTKNTVLDKKKLTVLQKFLVKNVRVQDILVDGSPFRPAEIAEDVTVAQHTSQKNTLTLYLEAVREYKQMFLSWQAGMTIDIGKVRKFFVPLLEKVIEDEKQVLVFHHYSTKNEYLFHHAVTVGLLSGILGKKCAIQKGIIIKLRLVAY